MEGQAIAHLQSAAAKTGAFLFRRPAAVLHPLPEARHGGLDAEEAERVPDDCLIACQHSHAERGFEFGHDGCRPDRRAAQKAGICIRTVFSTSSKARSLGWSWVRAGK
jgi:hypothetical protein